MIFRPPSAHNPLKAPAACLCAECSRDMLSRRCTAVSRDGLRCGDYKGHSGAHSLIVATVFQIAAERAG